MINPKINKLQKTILSIPKLDIVQCDYFNDPEGLQVVFKLPQSRFRQIAGYKDAEKRVRAILKTCKAQQIEVPLRIGVKLFNGATVLTCLFSKDNILTYQDTQDIQTIAIEWNKASRFI